MAGTWRHYELGARVRKIPGGGEERLGLDRLTGKPVTLRVYPRPRLGIALLAALDSHPPNLAQPLELMREEDETVVARELAFGPTLDDLLQLGSQPGVVVAALLRQLLEGLAALHAGGRVHLRLSPSAVRFDLLAGVLKVTDLEQALVELEPPEELIPRYLEPEVGGGNGRPANDIYSVGRIGEALLRGSAPLGPWGGSGVAPGPLWDFVQRCQSPSAADRPADGAEALAQLARLSLPQAPALALPLGGFVRRHVRALRELRRWRAQPLPPLERSGGGASARSYRELLSSGQASRLWAGLGLAALCFIAATAGVAQSRAAGVRVSSEIPSDTCAADARPTDLEPAASVPAGKVGIWLDVRAGQTVAIDGCLLRAEPEKPLHLVVSPGEHAFRAVEGPSSVAETREVHADEHISLQSLPAPAAGPVDPVAAIVARLHAGPGEADGGSSSTLDPLETGLVDPAARALLASVEPVLGGHPELDSSLSVPLGLTLDGLRAAERRFKVASAPCAAVLSEAAAQDLGAGSTDSEKSLLLAAELLTVTRVRGGELRRPLRTEREGLERLRVASSNRLLTTVEQLASRPEIARCVADLAPKATPVNELSLLAIGQLPGVQLPDQGGAGDDSER